MLIVRSPVRISFGGGGTDLPSYYERFGGCVLSAAINKHFYTVLEKRGDGKIQIISADLRVVETWQDIARMEVRGNALEIPLAVLKEFGGDLSVNLFLASEIPPGTGLGSSGRHDARRASEPGSGPRSRASVEPLALFHRCLSSLLDNS